MCDLQLHRQDAVLGHLSEEEHAHAHAIPGMTDEQLARATRNGHAAASSR